MNETKSELKKVFDAKAAMLIAELHEWFEEETASIDGTVSAEAPSGGGGSIVAKRPVIDSKRVVDATIVTKKVLGIELPPEIIKPGGYVSFDELIKDIIPKLEKVFTGEIKVKQCKPAKELATV